MKNNGSKWNYTGCHGVLGCKFIGVDNDLFMYTEVRGIPEDWRSVCVVPVCKAKEDKIEYLSYRGIPY